jgi:uncharacterized protein YndB with AHSA1/START domain
MAVIRHSVSIQAARQRVFDLVGTATGLTHWWAADVTKDPASDAVEAGFFNRANVYRLRPASVRSPTEMEWVCETGKEWAGTRLVFHLKADGAIVRVRFNHADWRGETDYFIDCTTT